ncbi:MAG TPA: 30S ribosomal protein S6 [Candidatus Omnitrophota bacterium]|nr:30S ribosomal protein S6 [Candidatus Omnitrophota bacterium]
MAKNELLRKYELVIIVDAKLTSDAKEAVRKEATEMIKKFGGKVINSQVWLERHKLAFVIKKCNEGTYYVINFEGASSIIAEIKPLLSIHEKILRFDFVKLASKKEAVAA